MKKLSFAMICLMLILGSTACVNVEPDVIQVSSSTTSSSSAASTYTVTYSINGGLTGTLPTDNTAYASGATVTVKSGLASGTKTTHVLMFGWNAQANGLGTCYQGGSTFTISSNTTLYARWMPVEVVAVPAKTAVSIGWTGVAEPIHTVSSISSFQIGKFEVTYALWTNVVNWALTNGYTFTSGSGYMGDGTGDTPQHPVSTINHNDVLAWCNALSERSGLAPVYYTESAQTIVYKTALDTTSTVVKISTAGANACVKWTANGYRLPTEAEWEYAARRKSDGSLSDGDKPSGYYGTTLYNGATVLADWGPYAWYSGNSGYSTHVVGEKLPNAIGVYDMSANIWEWCWDWSGAYSTSSPYTDTNSYGAASGSYRVLRGGCFYSPMFGDCLRTSDRYSLAPTFATEWAGFRVVRGGM